TLRHGGLTSPSRLLLQLQRLRAGAAGDELRGPVRVRRGVVAALDVDRGRLVDAHRVADARDRHLAALAGERDLVVRAAHVDVFAVGAGVRLRLRDAGERGAAVDLADRAGAREHDLLAAVLEDEA